MVHATRTLSAKLHRRAVAFGLVTLVGLIAGVTMAFAGSQGDQGGPTAYALVDPTSGSPQLVAGHTFGFTAVTVGDAGQGDYCLRPAPGVDVVHTAAVADQDATYSNVFAFVTVRYPTGGSGSPINCPTGQLEVKTFDSNQSGLTNQASFTVNVP
jgi:hypothetical protein